MGLNTQLVYRWLCCFFRAGFSVAAFSLVSAPLSAQFLYFEDFRGSSAPGWTLDQGDTNPGPRLTAEATPQAQDPEFGDPELDVAGNGWLRLATATGNQDNSVYLDTSIPSSANEITISFDFTAWDSSQTTGADGISVFLWDADVPFGVGAEGGSLSYAQKTNQDGLNGAYVGVGLDVWGNFSNATEGRTGSDPGLTIGGNSENPGFLPNQVVVRGPDDSASQDGSGNYYYLAGTGGKDYTSAGDDSIQDLVDYNPTNGNLAFPNQDFRPDQDASQYRRFQMTLDGSDQLTVFVEFGYGTGFIELYTVDLSTFTRPENLRIGFGSATGGVNQVYEIRNLLISANGVENTWYWTDAQLADDRLWSSSTNWTPQSVPGEGSNMYADVVFNNQFSTSPLANATIEVDGGDKTLADIFFSGKYGFTLDPESSQTFIMDTNNSGASEINVLNNPEGNADHTINVNMELQNQLEVNNLVEQQLTFNGDIDTNGNDIVVDSEGVTSMTGVISEGGDMTKEGEGDLVLSGNNTYTGTTTVKEGVLEAASANALGATGSGTTVEDGGTLALSGGVSFADEDLTISGAGSDAQGALYNKSDNNTWQSDITLADDAAIGAADSSDLTLTGTIDGAGNTVTFLPESGGNILVDGEITDSSGTTDVVFAGQGTTEIGYLADNSYSGTTTIRSGTVLSNSSVGAYSEEAFGTSSSAIELGDAQTSAGDDIALIFNTTNGATPWPQAVDRAIDINNFGDTITLGVVGSSTLEYQNTVTLAKDVTLDAGSGATMEFDNTGTSGELAGSGDITKTGAGTVNLVGGQSYSGNLTIEQGTVNVNGAGSSALDDNGRVILADAAGAILELDDDETIGSLAGGGATGGVVDINGSNTLSTGNDNTNTTFAGDITGTGTLEKVGTGTMTFTGSNSLTGELEVSAGTAALGVDNAFNDAMDIRLSGGTFATDGYADTFDNLFLDADSNIDFLGTSGGYLTFDDASRNAGTLTIDNWAGSLSGNGNTRLQVTASSLGGGLLNNIEFTGWGGADLINLGSGLYEVVPSLDDFYIWDGSSNNRWNNRFNWQDDNGNTPGQDPDFNGAKVLFSDLDPILDGRTIDLRTDITLGVMVIDNDDTFTISSNNDGHELFINNNGAQAVISTLDSTSPTIDREIRMQDDLLIQNNSSGTFTITDATNTGFDLRTGGDVLTLDGFGRTVIDSQITESGSVVKNGTGILELNDNNTFTGSFTQNAGTTLIGDNNALGNGTLNINGGTLAANGANRTVGNTFNINDDFTVGNDDNRDLELSSNGTLAAGDQSVTVQNGTNFTVGGDLSGTGGFIKEGTGTLTFSGNNSDFSGNLTVNDGTVQTNANALTIGADINDQNYLGSGDVTVNASGTLDVTTSGDITVASGATLSNAGTLSIDGGDDVFVDGTLTQSAGSATIDVADDFTVNQNGALAVSGSTMNITPVDQFSLNGSSGNEATLDVTNGGVLTVDISSPGGATNSFNMATSDIITVDGSGSAINFTGESNSNVDLDGRLNLTNSGSFEVFAGETNLRASTILDGGAPGTAGTLTVHGDLNVQNPGLANAPNITINADSGNTEIASISGTESIENIGTLRKTGSGTTTINTSVNNIQAQKVLIDGGTLLNGSSDQIENETPMELAGGNWFTDGYDEVLGTLTLSQESTIDLGTGDSIIEFAKSADESWAGPEILYVDNWSGDAEGGGTDQLYFGNDGTGLTSGQLGQIFFRNPFGDNKLYPARILPTGEVVPFSAVPEPSTYFLGGAVLAFIGWRERKRLRRLLLYIRRSP